MKAWRFLTFVYFAVLIRRRSEEHTSELQSPCNLVCRIIDRKSTRLNSSHLVISYAVFCLKKKKKKTTIKSVGMKHSAYKISVCEYTIAAVTPDMRSGVAC